MRSFTSRRALAAGVAALALAAAGTSFAAAAGSWSYSGATGPTHWGSLSPDYAACADGSRQSPINIGKVTKRSSANQLKIAYDKSNMAEVFNNGHTVEAEPAADAAPNTVTIGAGTYQFLQVHYHAPSEHTMNGLHYPVELHFVNKMDDSHLAVIGVMVKAGKANEAWQPFIDKLSTATANPADTEIELDWAKLLPADRSLYRYDGSLTTPGCAEIVKWNVLRTPITMSQDQINAFTGAYNGNNRPVQPLKGRTITIIAAK